MKLDWLVDLKTSLLNPEPYLLTGATVDPPTPPYLLLDSNEVELDSMTPPRLESAPKEAWPPKPCPKALFELNDEELAPKPVV